MPSNPSPYEPPDRGQFLNLAALVEGALIALAFGLGWLAEIAPIQSMHWTADALAWGVVATGPMLLLFLLSYRYPVGPFLRIKRFLIDMLGPSLSACYWYDLVLLALLAGFAEELLFRGVLQPWFGEGEFGSREFLIGLIASNVLFGLAHLITPTYAISAMVMGLYLGVLRQMTGEPNLVVPIVAHTVYDFLAFIVVVHSYRAEQRQAAQSTEANDETDRETE